MLNSMRHPLQTNLPMALRGNLSGGRPHLHLLTRMVMTRMKPREQNRKVVLDTQVCRKKMFVPFTAYIALNLRLSQTSGQEQALAAQHTRDKKISQTLQDIRTYLPSVKRGRTSDYLVHPTTLAHLRRRFNYICSALLRNDSLTDMSDRSVLYFELFEWLEVRRRWFLSCSVLKAL